MGLFRPSREQRGPDPYYHWKAILFSIGAGIALTGMLTNRDWMVLAAIPVLAVGVGLRWVARRGERMTATPDESEHEDQDDQ